MTSQFSAPDYTKYTYDDPYFGDEQNDWSPNDEIDPDIEPDELELPILRENGDGKLVEEPPY